MTLRSSAHTGKRRCRTAGVDASDAGRGYAENDGVGVVKLRSAPGSGSSRFWIVGPAAALERRFGSIGGGPDFEFGWRLADIREGSPQVYAANSEQFVAQMLNLDLLDGISFNKGCYTGQEIIARTQHLGRIKRRMFRLKLPGAEWSIGRPLFLADGRSGRICELAPIGEAYEALAVLTLDAGSGASDGETVDAVELPLPYSHESVKDR